MTSGPRSETSTWLSTSSSRKLARLFGLHLLIDQRRREVAEARATGGPFQGGPQVVGLLQRHEVVRATGLVQAGLGVAQPPTGAVEAGVRRVGEDLPRPGVALQRADQSAQVVRVRAGVTPVRLPPGQHEPGLPADRPGAAAGEQAERRGAPGHPREVGDEAPDDPGAVAGVPAGQAVERRAQVGRGEEDRLAHLRPRPGAAQPRLEEGAVGAQGGFEPCAVRQRARRRQPGAPRLQLVEGEQRRAQDEEARRREPFSFAGLSHPGLPRGLR